MKVLDLLGTEREWKFSPSKLANGRKLRSQYHIKAKRLLHKLHPTVQILEEVPIPVKPHYVLFLDLYIPLFRLSVEIHGEQLFKYIPYLHGNKLGFLRQLNNDKNKIYWCEKNNINIVVLKYDETINDWIRKLDFIKEENNVK